MVKGFVFGVLVVIFIVSSEALTFRDYFGVFYLLFVAHAFTLLTPFSLG